ncbi:hypothetical protein E5288_WYG014456 [Bos mutus]|uniref:Uncharacterized protein n=1 Tax=Bos mutus TaxID=72004 RepID=A0A6B0RCY6_9CETA|nr:hypothetical protein [Bos mutus]
MVKFGMQLYEFGVSFDNHMPADGTVLRRSSALSEDLHSGPHTGDQSSCIISLTFTPREDGKGQDGGADEQKQPFPRKNNGILCDLEHSW